MGNSADRAWQLSQLVEGVLTAFNPSHGSLSCVETNCVSFASVQARKLNHSVCFSFPHEVPFFEKAFVAIHIVTPKGSDNARVWDTSNRAIQVILNNLKGVSSMLLMLLACSNSRIFARRACSSGLRFFLLI